MQRANATNRRSVIVAIVVLCAILLFPPLYGVLATTPVSTQQFNRYIVKGTVTDTSGNPAAGIAVYLVGKGRYSLDSAYTVLYMPQTFSGDYPSAVTASNGTFVLSSSLMSDQRYPDSLAVMIASPLTFGQFMHPIDSLGTASTEGYIEYRNSSCSCSPTGVRGVYNGTQFVWEGYAIVSR